MEISAYVLTLPALAYVPLLVVTSCVILHYLVYWRRTAQWRKSNIPFLPPSFLIGHKYFWRIFNNCCLDPIDRIYRENSDKDVVGFFMATMPVVLVRNPALIKQIFAKVFEKGIGVLPEDEVAKHMPALSTDKELWKSSRKMLSPMYSTARVSGQQFAKITDQIHNMWTHIEQARLKGKPINIKQVSIIFLFDGISKSLFGLDANSYEKTGELIRMVQTSTEPGLIEMFKSLARFYFQGIRASKFQTQIPEERVESMKNMIEKQMAKREQTKSNENDFIDLLIKLKEENEEKTSSSETNITKQIVAFGFSILFGFENLLNGILKALQGAFNSANEYLPGSTIHLLSLHPEYQDRIRQEIEEAMRKHNTTEFTYEVVQDLHFLAQCLHETARLYPTGAILTRICEEDFKLPCTDFTLKKGERVIIDPYSVHRDPKYFKNPDEFNPDRFSPENKGAIPPETFLTFGSGPRKCPGKSMALLMMSAMIGSIIYKYEVKPHSHVKQMDMCDFHPRTFSIRPKDEFLVDIVPRDVTVR